MIFIYSIIQAIRVIRVAGISQELDYLMQALDDCSVTWQMGKVVRKRPYLS